MLKLPMHKCSAASPGFPHNQEAISRAQAKPVTGPPPSNPRICKNISTSWHWGKKSNPSSVLVDHYKICCAVSECSGRLFMPHISGEREWQQGPCDTLHSVPFWTLDLKSRVLGLKDQVFSITAVLGSFSCRLSVGQYGGPRMEATWYKRVILCVCVCVCVRRSIYVCVHVYTHVCRDKEAKKAAETNAPKISAKWPGTRNNVHPRQASRHKQGKGSTGAAMIRKSQHQYLGQVMPW